MNVLIFILFLMIPQILWAGEYAVSRPDGGVSLVVYNENSEDTLEEVLRDLGLYGQPIKKVTDADKAAVEYRDAWALNDIPMGKKIKVDEDKVHIKNEMEKVKDIEKKRIMEKLKLTEDELAVLLNA